MKRLLALFILLFAIIFINGCGTSTSPLIIQYVNNNQLDKVIDYGESGQSLTKTDVYGYTPLMEAIYYGRKEIFLYLLQKTDVNFQSGSKGKTALIVAAYKNKPWFVKKLLEHGADPNIHLKGSNAAALECALSQAILPESSFVLPTGSSDDKFEVVKMLVSNGADVNNVVKGIHYIKNVKNSGEVTIKVDSWTPLFFAIYNGDTAVVRYLLEHGADPNFTTPGLGWRPLTFTLLNSLLSHEQKEYIALQLVNAGASVNVSMGPIPSLIFSGAVTPIHIASRDGYTKLARVLIDKGADVNGTAALKNKYGETEHWTPLMLAAYNGHAEIVSMLLDAGADPSIKVPETGKTALDLAQEKHNWICWLLIRNKMGLPTYHILDMLQPVG